MKFTRLLLIPIMLSLISCKHATKITITGVVDSMNDARITLRNKNFRIVYDSTIVKNNRFVLNATVPAEGFYQLNIKSLKSQNGINWLHSSSLYLENGQNYTLNLTGPHQFLYEHYIVRSSSHEQNKFSDYMLLSHSIRDSLVRVKKGFLNLMNTYSANLVKYDAYADSFNLATKRLEDSSGTFAIHRFIQKKDNNNTIIVPYLITTATDLRDNYDFYRNALNNLDHQVRESRYFKRSEQLLKSVKLTHKGARIQPIYGNDVNDKPLNIDYKKHKLILIDFWASYCYPCRRQTPKLIRLYNEYKNRGFEIISISIDENGSFWKNASKQDSIPWYNVCEAVEQDRSENIKNFVVKVIPANYLIDGDRKIIARNMDIDELKDILKSKL